MKKIVFFKSVFISIFFSFTAISSVQAYVYDYQKPQTYQFAITAQDQDKLLYTYEIISYLDFTYRKAIATTNVMADLNWDFRWDQTYLGAGSSYYENKFNVLLFGGHIRAEGSNFSQIAFTLCHEIGHYLGGAPKQRLENPTGDWSSAEGQSDWFAAKECLPKLYDYFKNNFSNRIEPVQNMVAQKQCQSSLDPQKCSWILNIAQEFADFAHYYYERDIEKPTLNKYSEEIVSETLYSKYPSTQCRVDTIRLGALCSTQAKLKNECLRPKCWFKTE